MFRLSSMLTRTAMLVLVAAVIWIARDPILRSVLIRAGESATGAKVEIEIVRSSIDDGKLYLKHLAIADPRDPMSNLVQADSAWLNLNVHDLLRRRFVVEECSTSQIVFGAPRSSSGTLSAVTQASPAESARPEVVTDPTLANVRDGWLDRFQYAGPIIDVSKWELMNVSNQLFSRWTTDLEQHRIQLEDLKTRYHGVHRLIDFDSNSLRNRGRIEDVRNQIDALHSEIRRLAAALAQLDLRIASDREMLARIRQSDDERIVSDPQLRKLDGDLVSRLLLQREQNRQAEEILDWYSDFRDSIPDPAHDFRSGSMPGQNFLVKNTTQPDFLIKRLQLEGEGRIAGVKFNFSGMAKNISTHPDRLDEPVTFDLHAQGNTHAVVTGTLDRSGEHYTDTIRIHCPDLPFPERILGDDESLSVSVSPSRASVDVTLCCVDGRLSGEFKFEHSNLVMQIEHLDPLAGGQPVADRINLDLASISDYQVTATIRGPMLRPTVEFQSNLGDRLAEKFNHASNREFQVARNQLNEIFDNIVKKLDQEIGANVRELSSMLEKDIRGQEAAIVADLNSRLPKDPIDRSIRR